MTAPRPVSQWIDQQPISGVQWLVLAMTALSMLVDGFDLQALPLAVPTMIETLDLSLESLGLAISSGIAGLGLGAAVLGMISDRIGRKNVLVFSLLAVAVSSALTALCTSSEQIAVVRFLNGVGVGGANVAAFALVSDYAPSRHRFMMMILVGCSIPFGSLAAGAVAPNIIDAFGWQGIFILAAVLPAFLSLAVFALVPDSLQFLHRRGKLSQLNKVLARLHRDGGDRLSVKLDFSIGRGGKRALATELLSSAHRRKSLAIWMAHGLGAFMLYLLASWLPVILLKVGWSHADALRGVIAINLGGILGSFAAAYFVDRGHLVLSLLLGYAAGIVALVALGFSPSAQWIWAVLVFIIGFGVSGNQLILIGSAAALYPGDLRATSTGFTVAVARIGAVAAPVLGAVALQSGIDAAILMASLAVPMMFQFAVVLWAGSNLTEST